MSKCTDFFFTLVVDKENKYAEERTQIDKSTDMSNARQSFWEIYQHIKENECRSIKFYYADIFMCKHTYNDGANKKREQHTNDYYFSGENCR